MSKIIELQEDEFEVVEFTLRYLIAHWAAVASDAARRRDDRARDQANRQYERVCLVYERIVGKSPIAGDATVTEAFAEVGVLPAPTVQLVLPDFNWQARDERRASAVTITVTSGPRCPRCGYQFERPF